MDPNEFESTSEAREALVAMRQEAGLTQNQVAEKVGAVQGWVSAFERGSRSREPHFGTLQGYARALGKKLTIVMTDAEKGGEDDAGDAEDV